MEKEPIFINQMEDRVVEHRDRFMELMETRHRNAMIALKIEKILSHEEPSDEYPTTRTPENIRVKKEVHETMEPILDSLSKAGLTRKSDYIEEAIAGYFVKKTRAQRSEIELKEKLQNEGKETTHAEMGSELFRQRTGESPKKPVEAVRREGYFILAFFNDDYLKFVEGMDLEESVGLFHRAMRFPKMKVDVVLSRYGFGNRIILHERQHFINGSIFEDFDGIEIRNVPPKKEFPLLAEGVNERKTGVRNGLSLVKDELLARIRDGSDSNDATGFLGTGLYKYINKEFSEEEQKEAGALLKNIEAELKLAQSLFVDGQSRGLLIYHLIDIPLLRFPERIKAIVEFYNAKINEFTNFIPNENAEKQIRDEDIKERLLELRLEIVGEAYTVSDTILGSNFGDIEINYDELQEKVKDIKIRIKKLRGDYDNLLAENKLE